MDKKNVGIIVGPKSSGSNMAALAAACEDPAFPARAAVVIATREDAPALSRARSLGLRTACVSPDSADEFLAALAGCCIVCLAGYLRLLPEAVLDAFPDRVLNVHPALLPKFGGKGMFGRYVHEAVIAAGETESGCTVHRVTTHYDEGPVVLQLRCPVLPEDTPESLAARVLELEHKAFPQALRQVAEEF